jgi:hypothetical protein
MLPEEKKLDLAIDYQKVFRPEEGDRVLDDIMTFCNMLTPSYSVSDKNVNDVLYRDGQRSVALRILAMLNCDPIKLRDIIRRRQNERDIAGRND